MVADRDSAKIVILYLKIRGLHLLSVSLAIDSGQEGIAINLAFKMSISSFMAVKILKSRNA